MAKYKVKISGKVQGKGKKMFGCGSVVTDKDFPEGNAEKLVASGHLVALDAKPEKKIEKKEDKKVDVKADKKDDKK